MDRFKAKESVLGINFGGTPAAISVDVEVDRDACRNARPHTSTLSVYGAAADSTLKGRDAVFLLEHLRHMDHLGRPDRTAAGRDQRLAGPARGDRLVRPTTIGLLANSCLA